MERISHYEIVGRLGQGGMGEVFEAVDLDLGRRVALKFIVDRLAGNPLDLRRFEREARVAASLHHPRIATLFSFDRTTERPFIVMELLTGRTLRDVVMRGPLPVADALGIAREVAGALAYAHRRGVVHRDIKPENLMFDGEGAVKITDFGLAKVAEVSRLTTTGATLGTAPYMAPESVRNAAGDADEPSPTEPTPSDVFALGVTLYEMLTGMLPFRGQNALAMLYAIANNTPHSVHAMRPEVPEPVSQLVDRMLEKDPSRRITAEAAAEALGSLTGATSPHLWAGVGEAAGPPAPMATSGAFTLQVERGPRDAGLVVKPPGTPARGPARASGWIAVVAMLVIAGGLFAWRSVVQRAEPGAREVALNNDGHDSLTAGNLGAARRAFETALRTAPRYAEAKLNLATVLQREGDVDGAAALYGAVIREQPKRRDWSASAHYGLGEIDLQASAWPSAIDHLSVASREDSTRVEYPNNLAYALIQAGRTDEALSILRAAQRRFPGEASLLKNIALAWFDRARPDSALAAASAAVRLRPYLVSAWVLKVRSEAALGDLVSARRSLAALRDLGADESSVREAELAVREAATPR